MPSISSRVTQGVIVASGTLLLCAGLLLNTLIDAQLQADFDRELLARAQALETLTKQDERGVVLDFADEFMPEFETASDAGYFQVWLADGTLIEASRSLGTTRLPDFRSLPERARYRDLALPDGRAGRMVEIGFVPQIESTSLRARLVRTAAVVQVAQGRSELDAMRMGIRELFVGASALLLLALTLVAWLSVRWGLRPLVKFGRQVEALDACALDVPLSPAQSTTELEILARQFNSLMERVNNAFVAEQRFSANVAHELRTPLAELRALSEVGGRWSNDQKLVAEYFREVRETTLNMETLVANLLALARHDFGVRARERIAFDLGALVDTAWRRIRPLADARGLQMHAELADSVFIDRGAEQFDVILRNLFDNSVAYSPPGGTVHCTLRYRDGCAYLELSNPAPDLEQGDLPHLFERFWRKNPGRDTGKHAGLGLALVVAYAHQLRFEVSARLDSSHSLCIRLSGPVSLAV